MVMRKRRLRKGTLIQKHSAKPILCGAEILRTLVMKDVDRSTSAWPMLGMHAWQGSTFLLKGICLFLSQDMLLVSLKAEEKKRKRKKNHIELYAYCFYHGHLKELIPEYMIVITGEAYSKDLPPNSSCDKL